MPVTSKQRLTIKSLDGLRGLAVLLVLLSHLSLHGMNGFYWLDFSGFGKAGVYLFFVLSAFLLTYQALGIGWSGVKSWRYWAGYLVRRVARIYPLYSVVLVVALILTTQTSGYGPSVRTVESLISHLLLQSGASVYWAIPVEFAYYLILPAVCAALAWTARSVRYLGYVGMILAIGLVEVVWPASETAPNSILLGPYLQMFLLGSVLAFSFSDQSMMDKADRYRVQLGAVGWFMILIAVCTIPAVWRLLVDGTATNKHFHVQFLFYGLLWSVTLLAALKGGFGFTRFFEWPMWCFLGRISFSIYLWHLPIVQWVSRNLEVSSWIQFLVAVLATLVIAYGSYRIIERPFIAWGHRITNQWRDSGR